MQSTERGSLKLSNVKYISQNTATVRLNASFKTVLTQLETKLVN